jgi:hypothetical protein
MQIRIEVDEDMTPGEQARLVNAMAFGARLLQFLKAGYLIVDENGRQVLDVSMGYEPPTLVIEGEYYIDSRAELLSIEEFNSQFSGWRVFHPKNSEALF